MKDLQKNKDISLLSNFNTPAIARYYFEVKNIKDVKKLFTITQFAKEHNLKMLFVGGGTNMLFAFDIFEGIVIKNCLEGWSYNGNTNILKTSSNDVISDISESLEKDYGQDLWHRFIGLPGSIGGAVFGNAGCFGLEIENNFLKAEVLDLSTGELSNLSKEDMLFEYRTSVLKKNDGRYFLVSSTFDLSTKIEKYHSDVDNIDFRENRQPKGHTCGSFFKNPKVDIEEFWRDFPELYNKDLRVISAGFLLEQSGLKGYNIGGAFFSPLHANFLMSDGTASSQDLKSLVSHAQATVRKKFGLEIENEVRIIIN